MSKAKHTPGPWSVTPDGVRVNNPPTDPYKQVADCQSGSFFPEDEEECRANARLIAAAPEMLADLKRGLSLLQSIEKETGYCTAVTQHDWTKLIARAEGRDE